MSVEVGSFYVIEFSAGAIKIGKSIDPLGRIRDHARDAAKFGAYPMRQWVSPPTAEYGRIEELMIARCKRIGKTAGGREYFIGLDFDDTVSAAECLIGDSAEAQPAAAGEWHAHCHGYGDDYLAEIPLFVSSRHGARTDAFSHFWQQCKQGARPAIWISKANNASSRPWGAHFDTWSAPSWCLDFESQIQLQQFIELAVGRHVGRSGSYGDAAGLYGLRTEREARVIAAALSDVLYDNRNGVDRLIPALEDMEPLP